MKAIDMDQALKDRLLADLRAARHRVDMAEAKERGAAVDELHRAVRAAQGVVPLLELAQFLNGRQQDDGDIRSA